MIELSIKVNNIFQKYVQKFDIDPKITPIRLDRDDPKLCECVNETVQNFKGDVDDIVITTRMQWQ